MRIKRLVSQRTKDLERFGKRCTDTHPNWHGVRCEFSIDEFHIQHIGENGHYVWNDESRNFEKRYIDQEGRPINV
jgi:hypothetical protein